MKGYPGYPVIKLIVEDGDTVDVFEYEPRGWMTSMGTITQWINKHLDTDHQVHSLEEFKNWHYQNPLFVVGLFHDDESQVEGTQDAEEGDKGAMISLTFVSQPVTTTGGPSVPAEKSAPGSKDASSITQTASQERRD